MIGDWYIGTFSPSFLIRPDYTMRGVTLNCASFKGDDGSDPMEEIMQIQALQAYAFDNSQSIPEGTILQSYNPDDILLITDGYESFMGIVEEVVVDEDSSGDYYIPYQIKIAKYIPPKEVFRLGILSDGDEIEFDDDWEAGFEKYNGACDVSTGAVVGIGGGTATAATEVNNYGHYYSQGTFPDVDVYRHEYMEGAVYDSRYGYLLPEGIRHTIPEDITGYTIVVHSPVNEHIGIRTSYVGLYTPQVGAFGEDIPEDYWDENWGINPEIRLNSNDITFDKGFAGAQTQNIWVNNLNSDELVISVLRKSEVQGLMNINFVIPQSSTGDGSDITPILPANCVTKAGGSSTQPNVIKYDKPTQSDGGEWVSGGIGSGGGNYPYDPQLEGGGGSKTANITVTPTTRSSSISIGG